MRRLRQRDAFGWVASVALHLAALIVLWQIVLSYDRPPERIDLIGELLEPRGNPDVFDAVEFIPGDFTAEVASHEPAAMSNSASAFTDGPEHLSAMLPGGSVGDTGATATRTERVDTNILRGTRPARGAARRAAVAKERGKERGADLTGILSGRTPEARPGLVKSGGGTKASEEAVELGLGWLARHQRSDGSWSFQHGPDDPGQLDCPTGATGLALLAFLGAGYTHTQGEYRAHVGRGLKFLVDHMEVGENGGWMQGTGQATMYVQAICAIALCEAHTLTKDAALRQPAQLAIKFIIKAQDPQSGGWRYRIPQQGDTSVVGWQMMALQSARIAELDVPAHVIDKANMFLRSVESEGGALYGYTNPNGVRPSTTAVGILCRMYLGRDAEHVSMKRGVKYLSGWGPNVADMYYSYYATQALHHWGGPMWNQWNPLMRDLLVNSQSHTGDSTGSWPTDRSHGAQAGGRLYTTCLSIMTLEVYYRHLSLYRKQALSEEL